ncbi:unnamed protein product [Cylicocyclus nassatus]|uniref:Protein kinase domain-containing protein n=1 Tax=Cylicocyclus nassatus TaxID=53992 RepID=A0AA36H9F9_CYLNA|nr:unnamed protein product [Cylicocyclus nassatus]
MKFFGQDNRLRKGSIVAKEWKIVQKLGEGGFGAVFKVVNVEDRSLAAFKIETRKGKGSVLKLEAKVLRRLEDCPFVPQLLASGKKPGYSYIVMSLLGPSLNKILKYYGKICSISTQVRVGINALYAIKQLHDYGFIHRDLKPANMAVGPVGTPFFRFIHIFDFGLAREYIVTSYKDPPKMRRPRQKAHFRGTLRYCSVNTHEKGEQGRHDDLWCLMYMLIELRGPLPWSKARDRAAILEIKKNVDKEELLSNCPMEFVFILEHLSTLNYYLRPNYLLIYELLMQTMKAGRIRFSDPYDWELKSEIHTTPVGSQTSSQTRSWALVREYNPFPAEFFSANPLGF